MLASYFSSMNEAISGSRSTRESAGYHTIPKSCRSSSNAKVFNCLPTDCKVPKEESRSGHRKSKKADDRDVLLFEEVESDSVSSLHDIIRKLKEERRNTALEVLVQFQKFQKREQRLVERVRELAEQNVSLQRKVSFSNGREGENMNLKTSLEEVRNDNHDLQQKLLHTQERLRNAKSDRDSIHRSYEEKEKENKDLCKVITRLQRTCTEQANVIAGLRQEHSVEVEKKQALSKKIVLLKREVSFLNGREGENMNLRTSLEEVTNENNDLQQKLLIMQERLRTAEVDMDAIYRINEEKEKDNKSLHEAITRLERSFSEQEKVITALKQGYSDDGEKKQSLELQQKLLDMQERFKSAESERDSMHRSYKEKEMENKDLHKVITRLQRTCTEQEKAISGLRQGLGNEIEEKEPWGKHDNRVGKMQIEQVRLAEVEQTLRRELDSLRLEAESLRHQNISLLTRLQGNNEVSGSSGFRLEQELLSRVDTLQDQGLSFLSQSNQLCQELLELLKAKACRSFESGTEDDQEAMKNGVDGYLLLEYDMKVQRLKAGFETLKKGLQTTISLLHKKSEPIDYWKQYPQALEENLEHELKAEVLLTSALQDKLFTKQHEIDQLQYELATSIRIHDVLKCEVQSTQDAVSSMSHHMKNLELQMLRKDQSVNQLARDLQDCSKELNIVKGILPKISEERDSLWEEVKQCSERNMLLSSEASTLRKKIECLEEDLLIKEGQITILRDSMDNKGYGLLGSPESWLK